MLYVTRLRVVLTVFFIANLLCAFQSLESARELHRWLYSTGRNTCIGALVHCTVIGVCRACEMRYISQNKNLVVSVATRGDCELFRGRFVFLLANFKDSTSPLRKAVEPRVPGSPTGNYRLLLDGGRWSPSTLDPDPGESPFFEEILRPCPWNEMILGSIPQSDSVSFFVFSVSG